MLVLFNFALYLLRETVNLINNYLYIKEETKPLDKVYSDGQSLRSEKLIIKSTDGDDDQFLSHSRARRPVPIEARDFIDLSAPSLFDTRKSFTGDVEKTSEATKTSEESEDVRSSLVAVGAGTDSISDSGAFEIVKANYERDDTEQDTDERNITLKGKGKVQAADEVRPTSPIPSCNSLDQNTVLMESKRASAPLSSSSFDKPDSDNASLGLKSRPANRNFIQKATMGYHLSNAEWLDRIESLYFEGNDTGLKKALSDAFESAIDPYGLVLYLISHAFFDLYSKRPSITRMTLNEFAVWLHAQVSIHVR